jgi:hypothetical protein
MLEDLAQRYEVVLLVLLCSLERLRSNTINERPRRLKLESAPGTNSPCLSEQNRQEVTSFETKATNSGTLLWLVYVLRPMIKSLKDGTADILNAVHVLIKR